MNMKWKDTTNYAKGQRGEIDPKSWSIKTNNLYIKIHKHIHYDDNVWFLSCLNVDIKMFRLCTDLEKAKLKAIKTIKEKLNKMINEIENIE